MYEAQRAEGDVKMNYWKQMFLLFSTAFCSYHKKFIGGS